MSFNAQHSFDGAFNQGKTRQHYLSSLPELSLYCIQVPSVLCSHKLIGLAHARCKCSRLACTDRLGTCCSNGAVLTVSSRRTRCDSSRSDEKKNHSIFFFLVFLISFSSSSSLRSSL
jgi:hypothetical protein